jgi:hypothetical protein
MKYKVIFKGEIIVSAEDEDKAFDKAIEQFASDTWRYVSVEEDE